MNSQYLNTNQNQVHSLANSSIRYGSNVFLSNRASPSKIKLLNSFDFQQSQQELQEKEDMLQQTIQEMQVMNQKLVGENDFLKQKLQNTIESSKVTGRPLSKQAIHVLTLEQENKQLIQKIKGLKKKEIYQEELIRKIESGDFDEEIHKVAQDNEMKKQHLKFLTHRDKDVKTNLEDLEFGLQNSLLGIKQKIKKLQEQNVILEHQDKTYQELSKQIEEERSKREVDARVQAEKIQQELDQQQQLQQKTIQKQGSSYKTISKRQSSNQNQIQDQKYYSQSEIQQNQSKQSKNQSQLQDQQQYFSTVDNDNMNQQQKQQKQIKISQVDQDGSPQNNTNINQNYNIRVFGAGSKETTQMEATPLSYINNSNDTGGLYNTNQQSTFGRYSNQQQRQKGEREEKSKEKTIPVTHIQL